MGIKHIHIENFKSYRELDVTLGPLNVLIGANASGKSNFVEIFRFLHDIAAHGIEDAISLQGGVQYLLNAQNEQERVLSVSVSADASARFIFEREDDEEIEGVSDFDVKVREVIYSFTLEFAQDERAVIREDRLDLTCDFTRITKEDSEGDSDEFDEANSLGSGTVSLITNHEGLPKCILAIPSAVPLKERFLVPPRSIASKEAAPQSLLLETHFFHLPIFFFPSRVFWDREIALHNFNCQLAKKQVEVSGRSTLEKDGSNLALVLRKVLDDQEEKQRFLRLYSELLPFVADVDVEKFDRSLLIKLEETYSPDLMFPATFTSDGTIDAAALIVGLYFQDREVVVIEEPERNLHPYLIAKLAAMLEDVSEQKQIIVTSHSPELVKHANHEHILLVSRERDGHSEISRPAETEHVRVFLENDLGIEDLFVDNLLEG